MSNYTGLRGLKRDAVMLSLGVLVSYSTIFSIPHVVEFNRLKEQAEKLCSHEELDSNKVIVKTSLMGEVIVICDRSTVNNFNGIGRVK